MTQYTSELIMDDSQPTVFADLELDAELQSLLTEHSLFRLALEKLPLGLSMFDQNDILVLANSQYREIWGLTEQVTRPGTSFQAIIQATPGQETEQSTAQPKPVAGSVGQRRREWALDDGRTIEIVVTSMADGSCVALHRDITVQKRAEAQIAFLANHDHLTGLPNRRAMNDRLKQLLSRIGFDEQLAILCLDLDRFKAVNDSNGHAAGDELLRQVAKRILRYTRSSDMVVRLGGDEFTIIQSGVVQPASSATLAERLIEALGLPFDLDGHFAQVGTSIGVAISQAGDQTEDLIKNADLALYRAKNSGRGVYRYFEPEMDEQVRIRRSLEMGLRCALEKDELHLVYQPLVSLASGKVTMFESLLRWQSPTKGNISPAVFIPVAEETGLILSIGRWVLSQACIAAGKWPQEIGISVNVSVFQLLHGTLLDDVKNALKNGGIQAQRLEVEITESVMIRDPETTLTQLKELASIGVKLAIDDFGTGYSSLSYLHRYPFDRIKVDGSFVQNIEACDDAKTIIRALIGLGLNLNLTVTVEGVETEQQLAHVEATGATEVQGFYFSKPVLVDDVAKVLDRFN